MLLIRLVLPDRPGQLGAVASAMGTVGADIQAVEIVERDETSVVNDFMLELPPGSLPDELVSACTQLDGVEVLWLSRYPESWGLESDIQLLNRMVAEPEAAAEILADAAPVVFHCHWALLVGLEPEAHLVGATQLAPALGPEHLAQLGDLSSLGRVDLPDGWLEHWGATTCAVAPTSSAQTVVLGRQGGPAWLDSELARLRLLASQVP